MTEVSPTAASVHSTEFKLLQAYCTRRRRKSSKRRSAFNESPVTPLSVSPTSQIQTRQLNLVGSSGFRLVGQGGDPPDELGSVADKLTQIVDTVDLVPEIETDSNDDIIQRLVELLREAGDELDGKIKKNPELVEQLKGSFSYSLFEKVTKSFLECVVPSWTGSTQGTQKAQIAMTFEVTNRLTTLDVQPMNRIMGFGAQFLQQNFSGWVQKYGGWEKAFDEQDNDDEVQ
ncbi:apoptosis facilitator Bcl-2-like protein 14 [Sardina pilchardus]|uniref:apoptosis facilitator Bcl-2-like protein 14 n=1 Tax=Sardina pilchardus TaxID=27697 RepID=UPI002E11697D